MQIDKASKYFAFLNKNNKFEENGGIKMRLKRINVKGLFGIFDHDIPLKTKDRITIIHGLNGFGKTTILKMVNAVFNGRFSEFFQVPFRSFELTFIDNSKIRIEHIKNGKKRKFAQKENLKIDYIRNNEEKKEPYILKPLRPEDLDILIHIIEREIKEIERIRPDRWIDRITGDILDLEDVIFRYSYKLYRYNKMFPVFEEKRGNIPKWLKKISESEYTLFIETERLMSFKPSRKKRESENRPVLTVHEFSKELAYKIQQTLAEYGNQSQTLDRTFPERIIEANPENAMKNGKLELKLKELEKKRNKYIEAGVFEKSESMDFGKFKTINASNRSVLTIYVNDIEKKLKVFEVLAQKLDVFVTSINERFKFKKMSVNKEVGFIFQNLKDGNKISLENLSSGEQHELVVLYNLLFVVSPNTLILIDEPEISLHVEWQEIFIRDLVEIAKLSMIDVLLATHSPSIIHDRWDLTIQLKSPHDEKR